MLILMRTAVGRFGIRRRVKGSARIACFHSFVKYVVAFARVGGRSAEVAKDKEKG